MTDFPANTKQKSTLSIAENNIPLNNEVAQHRRPFIQHGNSAESSIPLVLNENPSLGSNMDFRAEKFTNKSEYVNINFPVSLPIKNASVSAQNQPMSMKEFEENDVLVSPDKTVCFNRNAPHFQQKDIGNPKLSSLQNGSFLIQGYPLANTDKVSVLNESLLDSTSKSFHNTNVQEDLNELSKFKELCPSLNQINKRNFAEVLVNVLRKCLKDILLDDFYNFLYVYRTPNNVVSSPVDGIKLDRAIPSDSKFESLKLCSFILEKLLSPKVEGFFAGELVNDFLIFSLSAHEILRVFLSIKIIFDSIRVSDDGSKYECYLPRSSIYNAYYVLCKELIQKYPIGSNCPGHSKNIMLSQAQFGKVFRLAFPNFIAKRLGPRGASKFCYTGMTWNNLVIYDDIKLTVELSFADIEKSYESSLKKYRKAPELRHKTRIPLENVDANFDFKANESFRSLLLSKKKPLYSFVDLSNNFPAYNCSLRVWKVISGYLPQQSEWSKETMQKSVEALKYFDLDLSPQLFKVQSEGFSPESIDWFLEEALQNMRVLMNAFSCDKAYLHLYLIVALFISPIVFASDDELQVNCKSQLSFSLIKFVTRLENEFAGLSLLDRNSLMSFTKIIRKMISSIKLLLSRVKTSIAKRILRVMEEDSQPSDPQVAKAIERETTEIIYRAVITACNSLNWEFVETSLRGNPKFQACFIQKLASLYLNFSEKIMTLSEIPVYSIDEKQQPTYELPLKIFSELSRVFHEVFMADGFVLQLPIKLIELMVNSAINEFQTASFHNLGNLEPELSKEIFKTWWVYSTAVQEHLSIFSEVVALSMRVC